MRMNPLFGVFIVLMMMFALIGAFLISTHARAPDEEAGIQREEEIFALTSIVNDVCNYKFQRCSALLTYTEASYNETLDAEIYTIAGCTPHGLTTNYGPCWARSGRGADIPSRLLPALA